MTITKALMAAVALTLSVAAKPATAHERDYYYTRHDRDHAEHREVHHEINRAHRRAHDEGFSSRWEHSVYHRGLRNSHGEFHEDHPNTRHDHYGWRR